MKIAIFLLGAGGTGKTTARKAFCSGQGVQHKVVRPTIGEKHESYFYSLYDNCALAGNLTSGTDANTGPHLIRDSFNDCLDISKIAIIDGVMGSPKFVEMVNDRNEELHVVIVHFNLSEEEVVRRLMNRRRSNGIAEESLPEKTLNNSRAFRQRAVNTVRHFETKCTKPFSKIEITDTDSVESVVSKINGEVSRCLSMATSR